MMDKKMIRECGLEEDVKRFQAITEYTFITEPLTEDDDENGDDLNGGQQQPTDAVSPTPPAPPAGDAGNGGAVSQDMNAPQTDPMGAAAGDQQPQLPVDDVPTGNGDQGDPSGDIPSVDIDIDGPQGPEGDKSGESGEEITIDVDSLVKSQDETNAKMDSVVDALQSFIKTVDMYGQAIEIQNSKLAAIDAMLQRSNPSEEEILNIRSQSGAPFNQQPSQFWQDKKEQLPNYNVMMDNSVSPADEQDAAKKEEKYDITVDDISDINTREIDASFDEPFTFDRFLKF